jgi:hypothetical protein
MTDVNLDPVLQLLLCALTQAQIHVPSCCLVTLVPVASMETRQMELVAVMETLAQLMIPVWMVSVLEKMSCAQIQNNVKS